MALYMKDFGTYWGWCWDLSLWSLRTNSIYSLILFCDTVLLLPRLTSESTSLASLT